MLGLARGLSHSRAKVSQKVSAESCPHAGELVTATKVSGLEQSPAALRIAAKLGGLFFQTVLESVS